MSYQSKNLSALGYSNGFTLWHYRTDDALGDLTADGYFGVNAARMVRVGDFILLNTETTSEKPTSAVVVVTANSGTEARVTLVAAQAAGV